MRDEGNAINTNDSGSRGVGSVAKQALKTTEYTLKPQIDLISTTTTATNSTNSKPLTRLTKLDEIHSKILLPRKTRTLEMSFNRYTCGTDSLSACHWWWHTSQIATKQSPKIPLFNRFRGCSSLFCILYWFNPPVSIRWLENLIVFLTWSPAKFQQWLWIQSNDNNKGVGNDDSGDDYDE